MANTKVVKTFPWGTMTILVEAVDVMDPRAAITRIRDQQSVHRSTVESLEKTAEGLRRDFGVEEG